MKKIIEVKNLTKSYKTGRKAIDNLNFTINSGEILGFLGPNGAGKSTTINILSTLLKADDGCITFFEQPKLSVRQIKKNLGIVPQDLAIYDDISAYENVKFFASLYGLKKNELERNVIKALHRVGLLERKDDLPSTFSGGMKRRLNIACAIAHEPQLIIFDEPTVGIDPQSRNYILESILELRANGATIIYTTHYMEEVQQICDRVIIMDGGKTLLEGSMSEILSDSKSLRYKVKVDSILDKKQASAISSNRNIVHSSVDDKCINLDIKNRTSLGDIILLMTNLELNIVDIKKEERNLESIFLELTGKKLRD